MWYLITRVLAFLTMWHDCAIDVFQDFLYNLRLTVCIHVVFKMLIEEYLNDLL